MKILVTGGAGFIGSYLVDILLKNNHKVAILDNRLNFINNNPYYRLMLKYRRLIFPHKPQIDYQIDIRHKIQVLESFHKFQPEIVVHLAGLPMARVPLNHLKDMEPINMMGTLNIVNAFINTSSCQRFIYTSSSMAYGHFQKSPQPENVILNPINSYGACKAAGEYFVKLIPKEWVIVRPTSVYGFTDCANRVTQLLLDAAIYGKPAWIVKGEALDFSYVEDVATGFYQTITSPKAPGNIFNISCSQSRLTSDFAKEVFKYFPNFKFEQKNPTSQQVYRGALDIGSAQKILSYTPKYRMEKGLAKTINLMKKYGQISNHH